MKAIILAMSLFSVLSFAQDSFHSIEPAKCTDKTKTCLKYDGDEYQMIDILDRDGNIVGATLNTKSPLSSVFEDEAICYENNAKELCSIFKAMAGVDEEYYYDGGHIYIDNFKCNAETGELSFTEVIEWTPMGYDHRKFKISKCSK
jgi:hypothetical protein